MKYAVLMTAVLFVSNTVFAAETYKCTSVDDNAPYALKQVELTVQSKTEVTVKMDLFKIVTEKYVLDANYAPKSASMKNFLKFYVVEPNYDAYGEGPVTPFYIESALFNGGYQLRRGGMGGFIKTPGQGYSWAKYLCVLQ